MEKVCVENVEAVRRYSTALHCTMLLAKLCGLQTGMSLVVRILCPPYTVSTGPSPPHTQPGYNIRILLHSIIMCPPYHTVSMGRCGPATELHGPCTLHSCH